MSPKPVNETDNSPAKRKARPRSRSSRAGLNLPVSRVHKILKDGYYTPRVSLDAALYMTAVLEYLATEVIELASKAAEDNKRTRISPRHVMLAIRYDEELSRMLPGLTISQSGVVPHIEQALLPKKTIKKKQSPGSSQEH